MTNYYCKFTPENIHFSQDRRNWWAQVCVRLCYPMDLVSDANYVNNIVGVGTIRCTGELIDPSGYVSVECVGIDTTDLHTISAVECKNFEPLMQLAADTLHTASEHALKQWIFQKFKNYLRETYNIKIAQAELVDYDVVVKAVIAGNNVSYRKYKEIIDANNN